MNGLNILLAGTDSISDTIGTATSGISGEMWLVAGLGLAVGAIIFGVRRGWKFVKSLAN